MPQQVYSILLAVKNEDAKCKQRCHWDNMFESCCLRYCDCKFFYYDDKEEVHVCQKCGTYFVYDEMPTYCERHQYVLYKWERH